MKEFLHWKKGWFLSWESYCSERGVNTPKKELLPWVTIPRGVTTLAEKEFLNWKRGLVIFLRKNYCSEWGVTALRERERERSYYPGKEVGTTLRRSYCPRVKELLPWERSSYYGERDEVLPWRREVATLREWSYCLERDGVTTDYTELEELLWEEKGNKEGNKS